MNAATARATNAGLKLGRQLIALLLLVLWPAVSSHALLQHSGLIHQFHTDHDEDSDGSDVPNGPHEHHGVDHDAADGVCLLSAKEVSVLAPNSVVPPPWVSI